MGKFFWRWKKKFWVKKNFEVCVNFLFFQKWKLLKIAWAAQKSYLGGGSLGVGGRAEVLPWTDNQTDDIAEWLVESLLASNKARLKKNKTKKIIKKGHPYVCSSWQRKPWKPVDDGGHLSDTVALLDLVQSSFNEYSHYYLCELSLPSMRIIRGIPSCSWYPLPLA